MNDLPPRDHNQPQETTTLDRVAEIIAAANSGIRDILQINDEETAGRCQGFVDQLRETKADLEAARKAEMAPHDEAIKAIRARYGDHLALLELARTKLQPLLDDWLDRKSAQLVDAKAKQQADAIAAQANADRLRRQAELPGSTLQQQLEARRAQEQADTVADKAAKPVARAQIKGEWSDRAMSQKATWSAEITDVDKAFAIYRNHPDIKATLTKLASADARRLKDAAAAPPGCVFKQTNKAV